MCKVKIVSLTLSSNRIEGESQRPRQEHAGAQPPPTQTHEWAEYPGRISGGSLFGIQDGQDLP